MADIETNSSQFVVSLKNGERAELVTADTYVDKNIVIQAEKVITGDVEITEGAEGTPVAQKSNVVNHSIDITPIVTNTKGYISGGTRIGIAAHVTAADLTSGSETISVNKTTDVTNLKEVVTNVAPLIITLTATVPTSGQNTISFTGLPSMPRAWTLDCAQSTANVTWNGIYRCISARYDGSKTYTYTAYKGNQGSANPYIYMVDNGSGFTQTYNNGTLTFTTNGTGSQTYCGPFLARTYVLMAVCDNDGTTDIYRGGK